jgi:hypothetical protein
MEQSQTHLLARKPLKRLKAHELHQQLFFDPSASDLAPLVDAVRQHGFTDRLHILPDGRVISDIWPLWAAQIVGIAYADVTVRQDLVTGDYVAIVQEIITCTAQSRKLSRIEEAACYREFRQLVGGRLQRGGGDSRDQAVALLGLRSTGRHLDLLLPLLALPIPIRRAIAKGKISKPAAHRILSLPARHQNEIACALEDGQSWKEIERAHRLGKLAGGSFPARLMRLKSELREAVEILDDDELDPRVIPQSTTEIIAIANHFARSLQKKVSQPTLSGSASMPSDSNISIQVVSNPDQSGV